MKSIESEKERRILLELSTYPDSIREPVATDAEIATLESELGPLPPQVVWFLRECGGGVVGCEHLDGARELSASNVKFCKESGPDGWTMENVLIVGWDGGGNPIGIHRESGAVLIEDHNFGGVYTEAPSFVDYLLKIVQS